MTHEPLTSWCLGTSKNYFKNTDIVSPQNHNIVLLPLFWSNTAQKHKLHFQSLYPPNYHQIKYNRCDVSLEHFILPLRCWHHCPDGLKLHHNQANKGNDKYDEESQTAPWLSCHKPRCHHLIPSIRYNYECSLGRLIFIWGKRLQQSMWQFFHGLDCKRSQSYQNQWRIFYLMHHPPFHCRVSRRSQTWHPFLQLQRLHDVLDDPQRIGPPSPKNTSQLQ